MSVVSNYIDLRLFCYSTASCLRDGHRFLKLYSDHCDPVTRNFRLRSTSVESVEFVYALLRCRNKAAMRHWRNSELWTETMKIPDKTDRLLRLDLLRSYYGRVCWAKFNVKYKITEFYTLRSQRKYVGTCPYSYDIVKVNQNVLATSIMDKKSELSDRLHYAFLRSTGATKSPRLSSCDMKPPRQKAAKK